ncbi:MAG: efflux RND transporter periplasmic adaptor subunit [Cyanobacteria bacterium SZAS LIN-2]|nr:efflux RND transporter periplasmic adaptor subunit [Cyanobacteria bacterium SZAS LIN-2]
MAGNSRKSLVCYCTSALCIAVSFFCLTGCEQKNSALSDNSRAGSNDTGGAKTSGGAQSGLDDEIVLTDIAKANAKIITEPLRLMKYQKEIKTTGEIKADENRVFHINSMVSGRVLKDNVNLGDVIHQGQVLALVQNTEVARVYGDYVHQKHQNEVQIRQLLSRLDLAKSILDRTTQLANEGIAPQKDVLAAQNACDQLSIEIKGVREHQTHLVSETQALLSAYGKSIRASDEDGSKIDNESPMVAPRGGVVIKKNVTLGDVVNSTEPLYVVADLSSVWLDITVYDKDLTDIQVGEIVTFTSDSLAGRTFTGKIDYIQPLAGDSTRTFLARVSLPNPGLALKPGMFGTAKIHTARSDNLPYVPDSAIQHYGGETFVFEEGAANHYHKRIVTLGDRILDGFLAKSGITGHEKVVVGGSLALKAELVKRLSPEKE